MEEKKQEKRKTGRQRQRKERGETKSRSRLKVNLAWTQQYSINDRRQQTVMDKNTTNFVKECLHITFMAAQNKDTGVAQLSQEFAAK